MTPAREPAGDPPVARGVHRFSIGRAAFLLLVIGVVFFGRYAQALPPDPAARGLDVYVHAPPSAAPGGVLELSAKAYGFPSVTHAVPLAGATLEIGWDPEQLDGAPAPPSVSVVADAEGRARIAIEVPRGLPRALQLLVAVRHGSHSRTRTVSVARGATASVELYAADRRVVPTSTISAWVRVVGTSGEPLAGESVVVSLLEGGVARHSDKLRTDRGGLVMARVPIPRIDEPVWSWTLRAEVEAPGVAPSELSLTPREEQPGTPELGVAWEEPASGVLPGDHVHFKVRLRDATGQPVTDHSILYWIGPKGTAPPHSDKDWDRVGTRASTDGAGEVRGLRDAPTLVKSTGTSIVLVARAVVEGHLLEQHAQVIVGAPNASAHLAPEVPAIVPGLTQTMMLTVTDGHGAGVAGAFVVTGDGLSSRVTTDARGEAEVSWSAPAGVGAMRNAGPCAGGVAAAVVVRPAHAIEALRSQQEPFTLCVPIDRDASGIVRVTPDVARPGEKVRVTVTPARGVVAASHSAILKSRDTNHAISAWLEKRPDGTASGEITLPDAASPGTWDISVALPDGAREARVLGSQILVVPNVAPLLLAKRLGGRATPGGTIDFEAQLTDGHGRGLPGSVSAIVVDAFGGGSANVAGLDTRTRLCRAIGVDSERCTRVLERDASTEALRRALLGHADEHARLRPANDPGAHASRELERAFADVLHSLEGAVFEATANPQALIDARRKEGGRWVMNPELLTLVTGAMDTPPVTPGGEKLVLADLVAIDRQVTFDNVARRVTRLKLFTVLSAVRAVRVERSLDPDEPIFRDPNALLRRLVRDGTLTDDQLLDPWGGTIQYVRANTAATPPAPFLGVIRGFELRAPGPDGVVGTADDVRDPFARVVRSGSPYARAVQEDKIVDAKWDMVVSESTVAAWQSLFEELTGRKLGMGAGGLGLTGTGAGGGGSGSGIGLGTIGTIGHGGGRATVGISNGDAYWSPPLRTDAEGRVRLSIPLGAAETTWRVAFVGVPDGHGAASTTADVASDLPLSLRVAAGARWVEGDVVEANVLVRNRTDEAVHAIVDASAEGAARLEDPRRAAFAVLVPERGARTVRVRVRAKQAGVGRLILVARANGLPDDVVRHTWEIVPPGERRALTQTAWVEGDRDLGLTLDHGYRLAGAPRLVLERGYDDAVAAALESLEPERQKSAHGLADAVEGAVRVQRWATSKDTPRHRALTGIAEGSWQRALGRFNTITKLDDAARSDRAERTWAERRRVAILTKAPLPQDKDGAADLCPPESSEEGAGDELLDLEPPPGAAVPPCWGARVFEITGELERDADPERVARALVALADRPHRAAITSSLADRLRSLVKLDASGGIGGRSRGSVRLTDRARRAIVYAALLRAQRFGSSPASDSALFGKIASLRDITGGYGSTDATVAVLRALLASQLEGHGSSRVHVRVAGKGHAPIERDVDVPASGFVVVPLDAAALAVSVHGEGPGLVARFERPVLRMWSRPPPVAESPVGLDVVWPANAVVGTTGTLRVMVRHTRGGIREVDTRIPLPPGITLGAPTKGAAQIQGVLAIRRAVDGRGTVIEVPVRFGLAGRVTIPEATARLARSPLGTATAPARALLIR